MTTCLLTSVVELLAGVTPARWRVGVFGSVSRCGGTICAVGSSDVDLVLVHPPGAEREAAGVRRGLAAAMHDAGLLADVTILSAVELVSSGFWAAEDVVGLEILIDCCGAPDGPIAHP